MAAVQVHQWLARTVAEAGPLHQLSASQRAKQSSQRKRPQKRRSSVPEARIAQLSQYMSAVRPWAQQRARAQDRLEMSQGPGAIHSSSPAFHQRPPGLAARGPPRLILPSGNGVSRSTRDQQIRDGIYLTIPCLGMRHEHDSGEWCTASPYCHDVGASTRPLTA